MSPPLSSSTSSRPEGTGKPRPAPGAFRAAVRELGPLIPYALTAAAVILVIWVVLGLQFNEYSAPLILPLVMLAVVMLDAGKAGQETGQSRTQAFFDRSSSAASDSAVHIGALLALIGFSICLGDRKSTRLN